MHHGMVFDFDIGERKNVLLLALSSDNVPIRSSVVTGCRFLVALITCIGGTKVGFHINMIMLSVKKAMSKTMLFICKYTKSRMPMDLIGRMHKLA